MLHPCPLRRIRTPSSSFSSWNREGCCPGWEGCSGSLLGILSCMAKKARLGERHSLGFSASLRGCLLPPSSAQANPQEQVLGLCISASPGYIHSGTAGSPCAVPPAPYLAAGCHPPSGSRAVQLSCDFVWEQSMGPQLFWSRVEVVMNLAHHLGIPLTAACLKEVGIQHPYDGCTIVTLAIGQMAPGLVCPAVGMHL